MKYVHIAVGLLLTTYSSMSSAQLAPEAGISGNFSVLTAMSSTNSNLSTTVDAYSPNSEQKRDEEFIGAALGNITYTFGEELDQQIFIGTSREDIATGLISLEMGYRYLTDAGTQVSLAFLPTVLTDEVWQDPYNFDTSRAKTDRTGNAYLLSFSHINGSPYSVDIGFANVKIDEEKSGQTHLEESQQKLMNRNAHSYFGKLSYQEMLTASSGYSVSLRYLHHDTEGDAMVYDHLSAEGTWFKFHNRHRFAATLTTGLSKYEIDNPIFEEQRSDAQYSAFGAYEFASLFGFEDLSFVSLVSYNNHRSNIDFYSFDEYFFSAGFNIPF
ncbi:hypothetical protein A1OK_06420 [Enterovibrio norvegicus FF-454]|uniref:DUF2860 domain-containing protein n=1 Tax=Enterovibrio norvegicus FF-454 TaxID=1185651 RepID=A0A1E5CD86_9GAMM|nr:DUF2860 family protein [Enterovibrio norvegicus]OEE63484.1 hypothetical protein A1OK_06420 [Enterovibrio norvegicus FF-454]